MSAVLTFGAGISSWVFAAGVHHVMHLARYKQAHRLLLTAAGNNEQFAEEIGDIESAAADRAGGKPDVLHSARLTFAQPLFITLVTGMSVTWAAQDVLRVVWWVLLAVAAILVMLEAKGDGIWIVGRRPNMLWVGGEVWAIAIVLFVVNERLNNSTRVSQQLAGAANAECQERVADPRN